MSEVVWCAHCPAQIVQAPPHGDEEGRWVHGSTRKAECPSNPHGSTQAEPR